MILAFRLNLLIDTVLDKRTFRAVNDKFRVVDFSPDGWFNDGFQVAVEQLRFKVSSGLALLRRLRMSYATWSGRPNRDDLVHGMDAKTISRRNKSCGRPGLVSATGR